jgi:hypothetical protein
MKIRTLALSITTVLFWGGAGIPVGGSTNTGELNRLFAERVAEYAALRVELPVATPRLTSNAEQLLADVARLAAAIRARRAHAKEGELFSAEVATAFRLDIARSFARAGERPADVLARNRAELLPGATRLAVNERFPWQLGASMPVYLLSDLPPLPPMLQYRLVERDLVLIDIDAGLVIDILREALVIDFATSRD